MIKPWQSLAQHDPEVFQLIENELRRQKEGLEFIASENFASSEVIATMGNVLTNKYAEGRPGKRYYGGCQEVDRLEQLAIDRATSLFNCRYANVQPHSGAQANAAVYLGLAKPGDTILGMDLSHGGHLTHGSSVNFSGIIYKSVSYQINKTSGHIEYDHILELARKHRPKMIIAGASAYPRLIDFAKFRAIADEVSAYLMVDMAHIAGLVATGLHPTPLPYAHVVTTTTHKTLRGPRGGLVLWNDEQLSQPLHKAVFPGTQGGPLEHIIAAKAVCFKEAANPLFIEYQKQVKENAHTLAQSLLDVGFELVTGGTDNHLLLIDLSKSSVSGKDLEGALDACAITVNKNTVPGETRSPFVTSGIRMGTPAVTTRGLTPKHMHLVAKWVKKAHDHAHEPSVLATIKAEVMELAQNFPLYPEWIDQ